MRFATERDDFDVEVAKAPRGFLSLRMLLFKDGIILLPCILAVSSSPDGILGLKTVTHPRGLLKYFVSIPTRGPSYTYCILLVPASVLLE